ncbi:conditioned medium-induced protein 4 [Halocatena halophila]|uniref:conditioned medium-induced protein 4 n=1 Tax=Halocatena halophila TaxID=2814576 RepID=UPI002ED08F1E
MNEKTAELRDIFMEVTDDDTITETQEETRGSLAEDEQEITEKLRGAIERMRDDLPFDTDLSIDEYESVVRGFYDDNGDTAIADRLAIDKETVLDARHDLHLVRDAELDVAFDDERFRELYTADESIAEIASAPEIDDETAREFRAVLETQMANRRVNGRYTDEFEELLTDADLEERTEDVTESGLDEATEGMETNVSM